MSVPRNVLNDGDLRKLIHAQTINRPPHVKAWAETIFTTYILRDYDKAVKTVVDSRELNSPVAKMLTLLLSKMDQDANSMFHSIDVKRHPEWVARALEERQNLVYIDPDILHLEFQVFNHWLDYFDTLPIRELRHSVDTVKEGVRLWDRKLAKQKLISSLSTGVQLVESEAINDSDKDVILVRLLTEEAYLNEGAAMSHCVGTSGYYGRSWVDIYSLRQAGSDRPICTIEINSKTQMTNKKGKPNWEKLRTGKETALTQSLRVAQVKGYKNSGVEAWVFFLLNKWYAEMGIRSVEEEDVYGEDCPYNGDEECAIAEAENEADNIREDKMAEKEEREAMMKDELVKYVDDLSDTLLPKTTKLPSRVRAAYSRYINDRP